MEFVFKVKACSLLSSDEFKRHEIISHLKVNGSFFTTYTRVHDVNKFVKNDLKEKKICK